MSSNLSKRIKERVNIIDVIGRYIKVTKAGINHKACCPFHNEKTPSFFISEQRQTFTCFGCGEKGDVIEFVQKYEHMDFRTALRALFDQSGLPESDWDESREKTKEEKDKEDEKKQISKAMSLAVSIYQETLKEDTVPTKKALSYLENRGLSKQMISDWQIGYAPEMWQFIEVRVKGQDQGITTRDILNAGLIKSSEKQPGQTYDFFRARITFPIFDINGAPVGISARIVDQGEPKYLNSPDTVLFNKSATLYGLHKAKDGMRKFKYALLVEGQMDLLLCHQEGFDNAVATSGTSLTEQHVRILKRYTNNLMLVYDADQAGLKATVRAWTLALAQGLEVKVAVLPRNEDPASLLLQNKHAFAQALKNSMHVIEYVLSQSDTRSRSGKKDALEKLIPLVASLENAVDKDFFVKKISDAFDMHIDTIQIELMKYTQGNKVASRNTGVADTFSIYENLSKDAGEQRLDTIRKALAEHMAIVYIYLQQLHTLHPQPDTDTTVPDTHNKIATQIEEYRQSVLGNLQKEFFPELSTDIDSYTKELESNTITPDEDIVFKLEALYGSKGVELDFYIREIDISYSYLLKKIYDIVFDFVQKELKKAEAVKDAETIQTYTSHIYNLSLYKINI
ncbi:MAG: DNA primase [Patescibacteria group bacterium]